MREQDGAKFFTTEWKDAERKSAELKCSICGPGKVGTISIANTGSLFNAKRHIYNLHFNLLSEQDKLVLNPAADTSQTRITSFTVTKAKKTDKGAKIVSLLD